MSGVQIYEHTSVNHVVVMKGHVTAVETDRGSIECEYFVNCAGQVCLSRCVSTYSRSKGLRPYLVPIYLLKRFKFDMSSIVLYVESDYNITSLHT